MNTSATHNVPASSFARSGSYLNPGAIRLPRRLRGILSLDDFEAAARRQLPRPIFGYVAGAAEDNQSLRANRSAFEALAFRPRVLVDVSQRRQDITLFGESYRSPFGIAPMGLNALSAWRGDVAQARAAHEAGVPFVVSGSALTRLEELIVHAPRAWFQAYLPGDLPRIDALLDRVAAAGYRTLVITVDLPVAGNRENNVRSGFSTPLRPSLRLAWDGLTRPRWLIGTLARTLLTQGMPHFENSFAERGAPILSSRVVRDFAARDHLGWQHVDHIRRRWPGTLVLKGILSAHDTRQALARGVDGIVVSNHGGRQLDGAVAPLQVLPEIAAAAGSMVVMLDGGIRRGSDVIKALALGARCVWVGRPMQYAAAVAAQAGVAHALGLLHDEVDRNLAMLGLTHCGAVSPDCLVPAWGAPVGHVTR